MILRGSGLVTSGERVRSSAIREELGIELLLLHVIRS